MKQTLLVKLAPSPAQRAALLHTLETFNAVCNAIAEVAYAHHSANKLRLQPLAYYDIRQRFGHSSQMVIRAIAKVTTPHGSSRGLLGRSQRLLPQSQQVQAGVIVAV